MGMGMAEAVEESRVGRGAEVSARTEDEVNRAAVDVSGADEELLWE